MRKTASQPAPRSRTALGKSPSAAAVVASAPAKPTQAQVLGAALDAIELPPDAVEVAYVVDAWGIKGGFKVQPLSAVPEAIFSSKRWLVRPRAVQGAIAAPSKTWLLPISQAKEHGDAVTVTSPAISDRNLAEALKGCGIWVPRSSFPTPEADEFYWVDLIGLQVVNREGVALGVVAELLAAGPQSTLVLKDESVQPPSERLIPFVAAYVDAVDLNGKRITVDWQPDY